MPTIQECITQGAALLRLHQIPNPISESKILLRAALNLSLEQMLLQQNDQLKNLNIEQFHSLLTRRAKGEPIAYIMQNKEFYGIDFFIDNNVLIPRPDTEILVQKILDRHDKLDNAQILELGVGSGCIILAILKNLPNATGLGIDVSKAALTIAQKNAIRLGVQNQITLKQSDWYQNVTGKFDVIVSNPPYVSKKFSPSKELSFEPATALFAESDGLEHYWKIANDAKNFLKKEGSCYVEIGKDTERQVTEIFYQKGMMMLAAHKDFAQINRCLEFGLSNST
jgi:release factor glutamine methyltransferase